MKNKPFFSAMLAGLLAFGLTLSSCASSAAKQAIMSAASIEEVTGLKNKLTWLESNAESGDSYVIEIDTDEIIDKTDGFSEILTETILHKGYLSYKNRSDITITLKGVEMTEEGFEKKMRIEMEERRWSSDKIEQYLKSEDFKNMRRASLANAKSNRTISSSYNNGTTIFTVGSGVTLVLDNIKIQTGSVSYMRPQSKYDGALVEVYDGGTLVMNKGSTITGAVYPGNGVPGSGGYASINSGGGVHVNGGTLVMNDGSTIIFNTNKSRSGGGVHVSSGGTFIMKGGTIAGNACFPIPDAAVAIASKGKYNAIREEHYKGGGVYVSGKATFTKTGGTITGHASDSEIGNQVRDFAGNNLAQNSGYAIYFDGSKGKEPKSIDTTVGPEVNLHFSSGKFNENWNE